MAQDTKDQGAPVDPRVYFAAERTLLAWVRTGLALMGFGFVVARFGLFLREIAGALELRAASHPGLARVTSYGGTGLILLGVVTLLLSLAGHQREVARLERGQLAMPSRWSLGAVLSLILTGLGLGLAAYLAVEL